MSVLLGLPSILGPEPLSTLRAMRHGDEIALVDGNYPALTHARRPIRADGLRLIPMLDAVHQVIPLDDFVSEPLFRATVKGDPDMLDPIHQEMMAVRARRAPEFAVVPLAGEAFYDRVLACHAIVATGEPKLYANIVVRKGGIHPGAGT